MLAAEEDPVTELPTHLDDLSFDDRLARLLPVAREAAAWVTACEERWAREDFAPDAEPKAMRAAVARVLAHVESAPAEPDLDELEALVQEVHDRLDPMVPERDPGADDPWETLYALDFRGAVGLAVLSWVLTTLAGQGRDDEREWLEQLLADPRWSDEHA